MSRPIDNVSRWIEASFSPVIMVQATPAARAACFKNGLSPAELLMPYARLDNSDVHFRAATPGYRYKGLKFRMLDAPELTYVSASQGDQVLTDLLQHIAHESSGFGYSATSIHNSKEAVDFVHQTSFEDMMPWYRSFRSSFCQTLRCQPHELLDHPVANICIASVSDPNPIASLEYLASVSSLPHPFQSEQYDVGLPRLFILIDDSTNPPEVSPRDILSTIKAHFPPNVCFLLKLNTLTLPDTTQVDIWSKHFLHRFVDYEPIESRRKLQLPIGAYLSSDDLSSIQSLMIYILSDVIIPSIERKSFALSSHVASHRKGIKNAFKSWWRKPKDSQDSLNNSTTTSTSGVSHTGNVPISLYSYASMESQTRLLADMLFLLKDYDGARQHYKSIREDFRSAKAYIHYASVCEMMALCDICQRDSQNAEISLDLAATAYYHAAQDALSSMNSGVANYRGGPTASSTSQPLSILSSMANNAVSGALSGISSLLGAQNENSASNNTPSLQELRANAAAQQNLNSTRKNDSPTVNLVASPPSGLSAHPVDAESAAKDRTQLRVAAQRAAIRGATRCTLWLVEVMKARRRGGRTISSILRRAASAETEATPVTPVLLEHAALCFLFSSHPGVRKYAFLLVAAAQSYSNCDSELAMHSVRCLSRAQSVYHDKAWLRSQLLLQSTLAKHVDSLGDSGTACGFLKNIFADCVAQSHPSAQRALLQQLANTYTKINKSSGKTIMDACGLPTITSEMPIVVTCSNGQNTMSAIDAISAGDFNQAQTWLMGDSLVNSDLHRPDRRLEFDAVQRFSRENASEKSWRDVCQDVAAAIEDANEQTQSALSGTGIYASNGSVYQPITDRADELKRVKTYPAGEVIFVGINVSNPLGIPLDLHDIQLCCTFTPDSAEDEHVSKQFSYTLVGQNTHATSCVRVVPTSIQLAPHTTNQVWLGIQPITVGKLEITGIEWEVAVACENNAMNVVRLHCKEELHPSGLPQLRTKAQRARRMKAPNMSLKMKIEAPRPLVSVDWDITEQGGMKQTVPTIALYVGEYRWVKLNITNSSQSALLSCILYSHPCATATACLAIPNKQESVTTDAGVDSPKFITPESCLRGNLYDLSSYLPTNGLGIGKTVSFPVCIFSRYCDPMEATTGPLHFSIQASTQTPTELRKVIDKRKPKLLDTISRSCICSLNITLNVPFKIDASIQRAHVGNSSQNYVSLCLGTDLEHSNTSYTIEVTRIHLASPEWAIQSAFQQDNISSPEASDISAMSAISGIAPILRSEHIHESDQSLQLPDGSEYALAYRLVSKVKAGTGQMQGHSGETIGMIQRQHANELVERTLHRFREEYCIRREALAQADDLPPTLRSIRLEKAEKDRARRCAAADEVDNGIELERILPYEYEALMHSQKRDHTHLHAHLMVEYNIVDSTGTRKKCLACLFDVANTFVTDTPQEEKMTTQQPYSVQCGVISYRPEEIPFSLSTLMSDTTSVMELPLAVRQSIVSKIKDDKARAYAVKAFRLDPSAIFSSVKLPSAETRMDFASNGAYMNRPWAATTNVMALVNASVTENYENINIDLVDKSPELAAIIPVNVRIRYRDQSADVFPGDWGSGYVSCDVALSTTDNKTAILLGDHSHKISHIARSSSHWVQRWVLVGFDETSGLYQASAEENVSVTSAIANLKAGFRATTSPSSFGRFSFSVSTGEATVVVNKTNPIETTITRK